jgi:hypothetical protein
MNRILPERVIDAYQRTKLQPVRQSWVERRDEQGGEQKCACGLSAVLIADELMSFEEILEIEKQGHEPDAGQSLDISKQYERGFVCGFDGEPMYPGRPDQFRLGWEDGQAAASAVFARND